MSFLIRKSSTFTMKAVRCLLYSYRMHKVNVFNSKYIFLLVNRRLDEWTTIERFDLKQKIESNTQPEVPCSIIADVIDGSDRKITRNQKRKHDEINHVQKV